MLTPYTFFLPFLRNRLVDLPNSRSSHLQPTPRGGGIGFVFVASTSSLVSLLIGDWRLLDLLPLLSLPLAFVGLCDDRFNLPSSLRFGFQVLTACLIIPLSPLTHSLGLDLAAVIWTRLAVLVLLIVAVAAIINFTNFMDGIDGLVAGCMVLLLLQC